MSFRKEYRHWFWLPVILLLSACQTLDRRPPITLENIVQMSQAGTQPREIIAKLNQNPIDLNFSGAQLASLKQQGVSDEVLDYLLAAYASRIRAQARFESDAVWWPRAHSIYPHVIVIDRR